MIIDFNNKKEITIPGMNNGSGLMSFKMYIDDDRKVILTRIHSNGSIGMHKHETSDDINYVLSGHGFAICDDVNEELKEGICHICPKGSCHSIVNDGNEDLVLLTIVVEK